MRKTMEDPLRKTVRSLAGKAEPARSKNSKPAIQQGSKTAEKQISVRIDGSLAKEAKVKAAERGDSITGIVEKALRNYVKA